MSNKSSVEWLADRIDEIIELYPSERQPICDAIKQAQAMHKEEIETAYKSERYPCSDEDAQEYYIQTFGNDTP